PAIRHRLRAVPVGSAAQVAETISDVPAAEVIAGRLQIAAPVDVDVILRATSSGRTAASSCAEHNRNRAAHVRNLALGPSKPKECQKRTVAKRTAAVRLVAPNSPGSHSQIARARQPGSWISTACTLR